MRRSSWLAVALAVLAGAGAGAGERPRCLRGGERAIAANEQVMVVGVPGRFTFTTCDRETGQRGTFVEPDIRLAGPRAVAVSGPTVYAANVGRGFSRARSRRPRSP